MDPGLDRDLQRIRDLPAQPGSLTGPRNWLNGTLLFADYLASVPPRMTKVTAPLRKYPRDFEKVRFPSLDGVGLVGWLGRAKNPGRPGLILLPGLYTSKDNNRIRARSVRILREWDFNILTLDLRGIGESDRVRSSPGVKEADDITAAVRWFQANVAPRPLHLYAESLAAAAALLAAGHEGAKGRPLLDGRILSVSPYADPKEIVERFSGRVNWREPMGPTKAFFKIILRLGGTRDTEFSRYVENAAKEYGYDLSRFYSDSSPLEWVPKLQTAATIVHSDDDLIVPIREAHRLEEAARENPNFRALLLPWGNHCLYEMADPDWYWQALSIYFGAPESASKRGERFR